MIAVVIPNHLPHLDFLKEWDELKKVKLIVVQDIGDKLPIPEGFDIDMYDHKDIEADLGENAWIIPTGTSACRSYGYYKAWQLKPEIIITLDNDCYPEDDNYFVQGHRDRLSEPVTLDWAASNDQVEYTRGFPYLIRSKTPVYINHGLWSNVPDLDAPTALHNPNIYFHQTLDSQVIPRHNFFAMCGMNLSWDPEMTPAMYFGLFGPDYGFDQYDDIWAGVLAKKICDYLGYGVRSGFPSVEHRKQSNVFTNLKKQAPGMAMNENFWKVVRDIELTSFDVTSCYEELISKLPDVIQDEPEGWTKKFKEAALIWAGLFK